MTAGHFAFNKLNKQNLFQQLKKMKPNIITYFVRDMFPVILLYFFLYKISFEEGFYFCSLVLSFFYSRQCTQKKSDEDVIIHNKSSLNKRDQT